MRPINLEFEMLDTNTFKTYVKKTMGPVFIENGFEYSAQAKGYTWQKLSDDKSLKIGIGLFTDGRTRSNPEFRFTLFVDPEDIMDIRAFRHAGWPPKTIRKKMNIKVTLLQRIYASGYDAWIPIPPTLPDEYIMQEYANYLIQDLNSKIKKGRNWTKKTHKWEYDS